MRIIGAIALMGAVCGLAAPSLAQAPATPDPAKICGGFDGQWRIGSAAMSAAQARAFKAGVPAVCRQLHGRIAAALPAAPTSAAPRPQAAAGPNIFDGPPPGALFAPPIPAVDQVAVRQQARTTLNAAAQSALDSQTQAARAYFKPHTLRMMSYGESAAPIAVGQNPVCASAPRLLPVGQVTGTTEGGTSYNHTDPFIVVRAARNQSASCLGQTTPSIATSSATELSFIVRNTPVVGSVANAIARNAREFRQLTIDLDPAVSSLREIHIDERETGQEVVTGSWQTYEYNYQGDCTHKQRLKPFAWNANFPFSVVEMDCNLTTVTKRGAGTQVATTSAARSNLFVVPELLTAFNFLGPTSGPGVTRTPTLKGVQRDGNVIRVKYQLQVVTTDSSGKKTETRYDSEAAITLLPATP